MSKPHKLDLKALIAGTGEATEAQTAPVDVSAPEAAKPTVVAMAAPRRPAQAASPERGGKGTLKQRARQMSLYLEPTVYDQLRDLAFTERTKIHPLLIEALDLLFRKRGLKSTKQLEAEDSLDQRITG
jgi:hypothetical protein